MLIHLSTLVLLLSSSGIVISPASAAPATSIYVAPNLNLPWSARRTGSKLPVPLAGCLSFPEYSQKTNTSFAAKIMGWRRDSNSNLWLPDVRRGQRDLADCIREPPASITLPGMEDYKSQFRSGVVWIVGTREEGGGLRSFIFCSGSLIHPRMVLTAAHCLVDPATGRRRSATFAISVLARFNSDWDDDLEQDAFESVPIISDVIYDRYTQTRTNITRQNAEGTDIGLILLQRAITRSYIFGWTTATSTFGSTQIRAQVGYPASTKDVVGYQLASTNSQLLSVKRGAACGTGFSTSIICENLQVEPGNSGGPLMVTRSGLVLGVVSNGPVDACQVNYKDLFGTYNLEGLVATYRCPIDRTGTTPANYVYRVRSSCVPVVSG